MEKNGRIPYYYKNQLVYEWEQNLEEIIIYIKAPECILEKNREIIKKNLKPGQKMPKLEIKITPNHLSVGLIDLPPYLSEDFTKTVKASESLWQLDDGASVFKGHQEINEFQKEEMQKKMLLERFGEENAGFDFSDAEINGNVPDPKTFMGGIKYN